MLESQVQITGSDVPFNSTLHGSCASSANIRIFLESVVRGGNVDQVVQNQVHMIISSPLVTLIQKNFTFLQNWSASDQESVEVN